MTSNLPTLSSHTETFERICMIRLARTAGIGSVNFSRLLGLYGTASRALDALPTRFKRTGRPLPKIPSITEVEDEIVALEKIGACHLLRSDPHYPLLLTHIPDAPPLLFARGNTSYLSTTGIGIVGARNASTAGLRLAESISVELASENICVVSGLARGIDAAAHRGALYRGLTVAALAGGLDYAYPPENANLQEEIAERGCLITEAQLGTIPQSRHFPRRNRLIAGISQGCLIIEAALQSGTLITARLAETYLRTVFATPGSPLDPRSRGGNNLIKQGCILSENASDILSYLPLHLPSRQPAPWLHDKTTETDLFKKSEESVTSLPHSLSQKDSQPSHNKKPPHVKIKEKTTKNEPLPDVSSPSSPYDYILSLLSITPIPVDEIVSRCHLSVSTVSTILSELELNGLVERLPGGRVARLPNSMS